MTHQRANLWGLATIGATTVLLALLVANVGIVGAATKPIVTDEAVAHPGDVTVAVLTVSVGPGDVLRFTGPAFTSDSGGAAFDL